MLDGLQREKMYDVTGATVHRLLQQHREILGGDIQLAGELIHLADTTTTLLHQLQEPVGQLLPMHTGCAVVLLLLILLYHHVATHYIQYLQQDGTEERSHDVDIKHGGTVAHPATEQLEVIVKHGGILIRETHLGMLFQEHQMVGQVLRAIHIHVPGFTGSKPDLAAVEVLG